MHKYSIYIKFSSIHPHNSSNPFGKGAAEQKRHYLYQLKMVKSEMVEHPF